MQPLGEAEVGHARLVKRVDEHVGRLEVAVQDAVLMRIVDGLGDDLDVARGTGGGQWLAGGEPGEALALDKIHGEEGPTLVRANFVDGDDVCVLQTGGRRRFRAEPLGQVLARLVAEQEHLHCDNAAKALLPRLVNDPHAAAGDFFEQFVVAEVSTPIALTPGPATI